MRRILLGGIIGGLPGGLIAVVPLALHGMDVITSDQSQIGFIGVPLLFLGVLIGIVVATPDTPHKKMVTTGMVAGGVLGIVGGVALGTALSGVALLWLILAPAGMIGGAVLGEWWGQRAGVPRQPAPHH